MLLLMNFISSTGGSLQNYKRSKDGFKYNLEQQETVLSIIVLLRS